MLGVKFENWHSWDDWGLVREKVSTPAPEPVRYTVEVPGRDGELDLTESVTPEIRYRNRLITCEFFLKPGRWTELLSEIMSRIHGRTMRVIDDIDPEYYWYGAVRYDEFASDEKTGKLIITVNAYPYKLAVRETTVKITGSGSVICRNDRMQVIPTIKNTAEATIVFGTKSATLSAGTHTVVEFVLKEGNNTMTVTSSNSGVTEFVYRQGRL